MAETDRTESALRPMGLHPRATLAGYLGLLPFMAALLCALLGDNAFWWQLGERLALGWGAAILGYVSAVHWGAGLGWKMVVDGWNRRWKHVAFSACRGRSSDR